MIRVRTLLFTGLFVLATAGVAWASGAGVSENQLWDLVYRLMNFAILVAVLVIVARKPVKAGLKGRSEKIAQELSDLEAKRDEAKRAYAEVERRLKDAQGEREDILSEYRAQGERERERIVENAHTLAERIKSQAQFTIDQETKQAKAMLREEIADMSASLAEDLVKEKINADDRNRLVDEYLVKVREQEAQ